jgi:hypothetical protein
MYVSLIYPSHHILASEHLVQQDLSVLSLWLMEWLIDWSINWLIDGDVGPYILTSASDRGERADSRYRHLN